MARAMVASGREYRPDAIASRRASSRWARTSAAAARGGAACVDSSARSTGSSPTLRGGDAGPPGVPERCARPIGLISTRNASFGASPLISAPPGVILSRPAWIRGAWGWSSQVEPLPRFFGLPAAPPCLGWLRWDRRSRGYRSARLLDRHFDRAHHLAPAHRAHPACDHLPPASLAGQPRRRPDGLDAPLPEPPEDSVRRDLRSLTYLGQRLVGMLSKVGTQERQLVVLDAQAVGAQTAHEPANDALALRAVGQCSSIRGHDLSMPRSGSQLALYRRRRPANGRVPHRADPVRFSRLDPSP